MKIKQFANLPNIKALNIIAVSSLAIGIAASISAAPAQAVVLNSGQLGFSDGTGDFFAQATFTPGNTFSVGFNPGLLALVNATAATGSFSPFFPVSAAYVVASTTGTFSYAGVGTSPNTFRYTLGSDLAFNFNNGVSLTVGQGSIFQGQLSSTSVKSFDLLDNGVGSFFQNGADRVDTAALQFNFNDNNSGGGGTYGVTASPVPEPFTIIGTIIGGTAAFRMRKKLVNAAKN